MIWLGASLFTAFWIVLADASYLAAATWLAAAFFYLNCIPAVVRWAERNVAEANWRGMLRLIIGYWGLLFGPMLGSAIGSMTARLNDPRWTAVQGAVCGLVVGSLEAMVVATLLMSLVFVILSCQSSLSYARNCWRRRRTHY